MGAAVTSTVAEVEEMNGEVAVVAVEVSTTNKEVPTLRTTKEPAVQEVHIYNV